VSGPCAEQLDHAALVVKAVVLGDAAQVLDVLEPGAVVFELGDFSEVVEKGSDLDPTCSVQ
jgi:hypothetical protein